MHELMPDGGVIRKLWIYEAQRYCDHLLRLDKASRRSRFGGAVADDCIRQHVDGSIMLDAVIHGFFVDGVLRGAAELRPMGARFSGEAEAAFSVEKPWQSHGVGSELLARTLLVARNRGIKFLRMHCLAENRRMQQLARKFDADLRFDFGSVIGEVTKPRPTPISVVREALSDGFGVTNALLDAQTRFFKPT